MLRILRAASLIMGLVLLIMTISLSSCDRAGDLNRVLFVEAFGSGMFESYSLWLMQPETGRKIELVQRAWEYLHIVGWVSDGALIYLEGGNDAIPMLMRVEPDGTGRKLLVQKTSDSDKPAAWLTQNREWIVYLDFHGDLGAIRTDGSGQAALNPPDDQLTLWTIDDRWVAFQLEGSPELYWIRLGETELHQTHTPTNENDYRKPPLSPADEFIVSRNGKLFWLNPATGDLRRVVPDNELPYERLVNQNIEAGLVYVSVQPYEQATKLLVVRRSNGRLVWEQPDFTSFNISPDGRRGLLTTSDSSKLMLDAIQGTPYDLPAPFNGEDALFFSWSPDNKWLLLNITEMGQGTLWRLNIATGETRRIWRGGGYFSNVYWSPDSQQILAHSPSPSAGSVVRMNVDGSQPETLIQSTYQRTYYAEGWGPPLEKKAWSKYGLFIGGGGLCIAPFILKKRRNRERAD